MRVTVAGAGIILIVVAVLLRFYVPGLVVKFPLDEHQVTILNADGASYFSQAKLRELTGVSMTATDTLKGDAAAGNGSTAVWNDTTVVQDDTNSQVVSTQQWRAGFDRRTGVLVNCCGAFVDTNHSVHLSGQGFVWPFGAQRKTYLLFDTTLLRAVPATFEGTATVDGVPVYRYVEKVSARAGSQSLPGALIGVPSQQSVTLPEFYQATNAYWVDPLTGATVKTDQNQAVTLRGPTGATVLVLYQADLATGPAAVKKLVDEDGSGRTKLMWLTVTGPLVIGLVGIVLLAVGVVLLMRRRGPAGPGGGDEVTS